jgi:hypothetical protein
VPEVWQDGREVSTEERFRLAYADPPYLGCAKLYPEHPDAARWDDPASHVALLAELDTFDWWAMSLSTPSLAVILPAAPPGTRVAAWVKPFAAFKRNVRVAYTWEPVLFRPVPSRRPADPVSRDHLAAPITLQRGLTGAKPDRFNRWVLDLLGYMPGDEVVDLFPGTGGMGRVAALEADRLRLA